MAVPRSESAIGWCPPARSMTERRVLARVQPANARRPRSSGPRRVKVPSARSIAAAVSFPLAVMPRMPHMAEKLDHVPILLNRNIARRRALAFRSIGMPLVRSVRMEGGTGPNNARRGAMTRPLSEYGLADWRRLRPLIHGVKTLRYRSIDHLYRRRPARAGNPA